MSKKKSLEKLTCAHCLHQYPISKHSAFTKTHYYGDGDGPNDRESYHSYEFEPTIVDSCPNCGEDVHVSIYVPVYIEGEPKTTFDIDTFFEIRNQLHTYKNKWEERLENSKDYLFSFQRDELMLKILKAKTLAQAKKGVRKSFHKFVEFVFSIKDIDSLDVNEPEENEPEVITKVEESKNRPWWKIW